MTSRPTALPSEGRAPRVRPTARPLEVRAPASPIAKRRAVPHSPTVHGDGESGLRGGSLLINCPRAAGLALLIPLVFFSACKSVDVRSAADQNTDFSKFHTYNYSSPSRTNHPQLTQPNRQRIRSAVDAELNNRALRSVAMEPDLLLSIELKTSQSTYDRSNPEAESGSLGASLNKHYGLKYKNNNSAEGEPVVTYTEGTLIFRAHDAKSNRVVWEGAAMGVLYQNRPDDEVERRIRDAVHAVFAKFPIQPKR